MLECGSCSPRRLSCPTLWKNGPSKRPHGVVVVQVDGAQVERQAAGRGRGPAAAVVAVGERRRGIVGQHVGDRPVGQYLPEAQAARQCRLDRRHARIPALHDLGEQLGAVGARQVGAQGVGDRVVGQPPVPGADLNVVPQVVARQAAARVAGLPRAAVFAGHAARAGKPELAGDQVVRHLRGHLVEPGLADRLEVMPHLLLIEVDQVLELVRQGQGHLARPALAGVPTPAPRPGSPAAPSRGRTSACGCCGRR